MCYRTIPATDCLDGKRIVDKGRTKEELRTLFCMHQRQD